LEGSWLEVHKTLSQQKKLSMGGMCPNVPLTVVTLAFDQLSFFFFLFLFAGLRLELGAFTLNHSTSPLFVKSFSR
jgi:hypothetical protein